MLLTGFPALTGIGPSGFYVAAGGKTAGLVAAPVPESDTIILFGTALAGLGPCCCGSATRAGTRRIGWILSRADLV